MYKYLPPDCIDKSFSLPETVTLKFTKPNNFNDPYELFLTTDFNIDPELLAAYAEAIGELPRHPTTCFSRSPIVIPMWAHYAQNHQGFAIEFSDEELMRFIPDSRIDDVRYSDQPLDNFSELIARVVHIAKPRYTYMLRGAIFDAAYFTKTSCWSYEQERRMVVSMDTVRGPDELMLLDFPVTAVRSIACGARSSDKTRKKLKELSISYNFKYYDMKIGRSSSVPFLVGSEGKTFVFNGGDIKISEFQCEECLEPLVSDQGRCSWCQIDDDMQLRAASRNPYRILNHIGALEDYVRQMDSIGERHRREEAEDT